MMKTNEAMEKTVEKTLLIAGLVLWSAMNSFAWEKLNPPGTNATETIQVGKIKKEILDFRAHHSESALEIYDSSAKITPLVHTVGKASAIVVFGNDNGKPYYEFQPDFALKGEATITQAIANAGIQIPSTWKVEEIDTNFSYIRYSMPATPENEQKMAEFIHLLFTKIRKIPESDELKFCK